MKRIRRSRFLVLLPVDRRLIDVRRLLSGEIQLSLESHLSAQAPPAGHSLRLAQGEADGLLRIPSRDWLSWQEALQRSEIAEARLEELVRHGILLSDQEEGDPARYREQEERLSDNAWHTTSALYHFANRWSQSSEEAVPSSTSATAGPNQEPVAQHARPQEASTQAAEQSGEGKASAELVRELVKLHGPPPHHFPDPIEPLRSHQLGDGRRQGALYQAMEERRSQRSFHPQRQLSLDDLSTLLYYSFGCQGISPLGPGLEVLRRCSPSGGSLHPIEAYPMVLRVEGLESGFYRYDAREHRLDLLRSVPAAQISDLASRLAAGQQHAGGAHLLCFFVARFYRHFWKYRHIGRAYGVVLQDAGHISQNLALVATELGLASFYSGAVYGADVEEELGLDPVQDGVLSFTACGVPADQPSPLDLARQPLTTEDRD